MVNTAHVSVKKFYVRGNFVELVGMDEDTLSGGDWFCEVCAKQLPDNCSEEHTKSGTCNIIGSHFIIMNKS